MPVSALLLVLAAAVIHASWNLLLSGAEDTHSATAVAVVAGVIVFAPAAALTWRLDQSAVPYIVASSALETLYLGFLASGYSRAAMSFIYPVARGSAPVLVLIISVLALGASFSALTIAGVVIAAVGVVLVRGLRADGALIDLLLALAVGACIAGYTLVDKHGVAHASPTAYLELVFAATSAAHLLGVWHARGRRALRAAVGARTLVAGIGFFAAYALVLAALKLASAAPVAAVRESSVVLATAWLALTGRERVTKERLLGACAVAAGVGLISLG
jgi:drug/metabolite transporter (DMT)-like permease